MFSVGAVSYGIGAVAFLGLTLVLVTGFRGRLQGAMLVVACGVTTLWCALSAYHEAVGLPSIALLYGAEILRTAAWFVFLLQVLSYAGRSGSGSRFFPITRALVYTVTVVAFIAGLASDRLAAYLPRDTWTLITVILAIIGLVLIEQVFRNTRPEQRWAVKYLCLGVGGMFIYDFYLYSDALLFKVIDKTLWDARGAIYLVIAPLIAVSAARNPRWSLDVFLSRGIVFHTATLLGTGVYLLLMAAAGYYIRLYGGEWGRVAQAAFLFAAAIVLVAILFSGQMRARLKVFLSKHFFNYKYDYREEWLRFSQTLSSEDELTSHRQRAIRAIAQIVESPGGVLLLHRDSGGFVAVDHWNFSGFDELSFSDEHPLARFLEQREWVINVNEFERSPGRYGGLVLPAELADSPRTWLIVPLMLHDDLLGLIVLAHARSGTELNWEDRDLLKTAGRQAASYLSQIDVAQALAEARQFEAFHRLSAYLVHDLKNLTAQLSLIVSNAQRHKHNPEFVDDAIETVDNAVAKMNRMLAQLRAGTSPTQDGRSVHINALLQKVCEARSGQKPVPSLGMPGGEDLFVVADPDRLADVLEHIVHNAQEATPEDGNIAVRLSAESNEAVIEVADTGIGMSEQFIRERLFRPFDTTKGNAGMGIGAYEAREFVNALGGRIKVESEPGSGTVFVIRIPLLERRRLPEFRADKEAVN